MFRPDAAQCVRFPWWNSSLCVSLCLWLHGYFSLLFHMQRIDVFDGMCIDSSKYPIKMAWRGMNRDMGFSDCHRLIPNHYCGHTQMMRRSCQTEPQLLTWYIPRLIFPGNTCTVSPLLTICWQFIFCIFPQRMTKRSSKSKYDCWKNLCWMRKNTKEDWTKLIYSRIIMIM